MRRHRTVRALALAGTLALTAPAALAQFSSGTATDPLEPLIAVEHALQSDIGDLFEVVQSSQDPTEVLGRIRIDIDTWQSTASENGSAACAVHARLVRYLDYITRLAREAQLRLDDVHGIQDHALETLVDWHIATAIARAEAVGSDARVPLQRAVELLLERADAAAGTPLEALLRDRYAARVRDLIGRAQQAVGDMQATRFELLEVRLGLAIERLREAIRARGGSRELFEQIVALWKDRARAMLHQDFPVCGP